MTLVGWLIGCGMGSIPFYNEPPVLDSVTGLAGPPPEDRILELVVEAHDPEGDVFEIWFVGAWGTIDFDPHGRSGTYTMPDLEIQIQADWANQGPELEMVLYDPADPLASRLVKLGLPVHPEEPPANTGDTGG